MVFKINTLKENLKKKLLLIIFLNIIKCDRHVYILLRIIGFKKFDFVERQAIWMKVLVNF